MLDQNQIRLFRLKARQKGFSEAQINQEIARKQQEETRKQLQVQQSQKAEVKGASTPVMQPVSKPTKKKGIVGGLIEAVTKPGVEFGKFVAEAGAQGGRYLADPTFRKVVSGKQLTQEEQKKAEGYRDTFFVKPEQINTRGKILETGARRTAGAASYAVPGGAGVGGIARAGAAAGALSAFSTDDAGIQDVASGAVLGGAIGGLTGLGMKALKSVAAKKLGTSLTNRGKDIQLSSYTKNLGKPTKVEGGRNLLERMKKVGIQASDPDNVVEQANKILTEDGEVIYEAAKRLRKKGIEIPVTDLTDELRKKIASAKSELTKRPLQEVLDIIEADIGTGTIGPDDFYLLKTEYGGLGRWSSLSSAVEKKQAEAWRDVYIKANQILDDKFKASGFKEFRDINERLHTAMQASQYAARSGNVAPNKYNIGLYDFLSGIGGIAMTGNPLGVVAGVGLNKAISSPKTTDVLGRIMQRAGQAVGSINPLKGNIPQGVVNAGIVGATQSGGVVPDLEQSDEQTYQSSSDQSTDSQDTSFIGDSIAQDPQGTASHPIFGNKTKQEVLLDAFKSGLNDKQLQEIEAVYDRFASEEDETQLSDTFLDTGQPVTKADKLWLLENPDKAPGATKKSNLTEKERMFENAGTAAQQALDLLEGGSVATGIGQGALGQIGEKIGTNSKEQQRYRSSLALARTAARNALLGANMTSGEMESIQAFIPEFNDAPEVAKEKLNTFIDMMGQFSGLGNFGLEEEKTSSVKKKPLSSAASKDNPITQLVSSAGKLLSNIVPTASASGNENAITGIEIEGDNVVTRYADGGFKSENIDKDLSVTESLGKVFDQLGKKLKIKKDFNISEFLGYEDKEKRIKTLLDYNDMLERARNEVPNKKKADPAKKTDPGFDSPMLQPKGKIEEEAKELPKASGGKYAEEITKYFGDETENAFLTLKGENGGRDPRAENKNRDGSIDRGLFQINSNTFNDFKKRKGNQLKKFNITSYEDMFDPDKNAAMAKIIYDEQGWDGWYGAPDSIISEKEKKRRIKLGIGRRE